MKDKKIRKYFIFIAMLLVLMVIVEMNKKTPVDWTPTFINTDKNPYGTYICYNLLTDVFPGSNIRETRYPITNELKYSEGKKETYSYHDNDSAQNQTSYIFISRNFGTNSELHGYQPSSPKVDKLDVENLLNFVQSGNNVFISAESMPSYLLDTLKLKIHKQWSSADSAYVFNDLTQKEFSLRGIQGSQHYMTVKDSSDIEMRVLAHSKKLNRIIFIKIKYGQGYIYLHSMPVAFSNVELLKLHKYDFAFACLSYLPKSDNIIWDEYLKQGRMGQYSSFRVVWDHPALLYAYYIALLGALLFILFRAKRTQRIIPVAEPPKNSSVEFMDTISNLYYKKQAYLSIVRKRHNYLLEIIRSHYFMQTENIDEAFKETLSMKSGVKKEVIDDIFGIYDSINPHYNITNSMLLKYNEKLEEFYKEMK